MVGGERELRNWTEQQGWEEGRSWSARVASRASPDGKPRLCVGRGAKVVGRWTSSELDHSLSEVDWRTSPLFLR